MGLVATEAAEAAAPAPKNGSRASMSAFSMEGTKKLGVSPKKRAKLMAKARDAAEKSSQK